MKSPILGAAYVARSITAADNRLEGTQTLPRSFSENIRQAYPYPDRNENKLMFLTAPQQQAPNESADGRPLPTTSQWVALVRSVRPASPNLAEGRCLHVLRFPAGEAARSRERGSARRSGRGRC